MQIMKYFEGCITYFAQVAVKDDATMEEVADALAKELEEAIDLQPIVVSDEVHDIEEIPEYRYFG